MSHTQGDARQISPDRLTGCHQIRLAGPWTMQPISVDRSTDEPTAGATPAPPIRIQLSDPQSFSLSRCPPSPDTADNAAGSAADQRVLLRRPFNCPTGLTEMTVVLLAINCPLEDFDVRLNQRPVPAAVFSKAIPSGAEAGSEAERVKRFNASELLTSHNVLEISVSGWAASIDPGESDRQQRPDRPQFPAAVWLELLD